MTESRQNRRGLVMVWTGDGKGKTTAALGVAFRALGCGWKVRMIQFIKGPWVSAEKRLADSLDLPLEILPMGDGFTWDTNNPEQDRTTCEGIWSFVQETIDNAEHDLVILDEINVVFSLDYLDPEPVLEALRKRPPWMHIILTGRDAPEAVIAAADLVSRVEAVKHPFDKGITAQPGIDF